MNIKFVCVVCALISALFHNGKAETIETVVNSQTLKIESSWREVGGIRDRIGWIAFGEEYTVVWVETYATRSHQRLEYFWTLNTRLEIGNQSLPFVCHWASDVGAYQSVDAKGNNLHYGWDYPKYLGWDTSDASKRSYCLVFRGRVRGEPIQVVMRDRKHGTTGLCGGSLAGIIKPYKLEYFDKITENEVNKWIVEGKEWCGIYQSADDQPWKLACFKDANGVYRLVFLDNGNHPWWTIGEVKATLEKTAVPGTFMATFVNDKRYEVKGCIVVFDSATVTIKANRPINRGSNRMVLIKMFPSLVRHDGGAVTKGGGTGFALKGGYFVTNNHVVKNADWIDVYLGDAKRAGRVVAVDDKNDLALVKTDHRTDNLPYVIKCEEMNIGDCVRAFGFPLTTTMGKNIKLTEGIVNSTTGFEDDYTMYQISTEVQPGNSGGPLVNSKGEICGIVSAKHLGVENVNYAVKAKYLKEFLVREKLSYLISEGGLVPSTVSVHEIKKFVARLECGTRSSN